MKFQRIFRMVVFSIAPVAAAALIFLLAVIPIRNNIMLDMHVRELEVIDFGVEYDVIASDSSYGRLFDGADTLQYYSAELIYTKETPSVDESMYPSVVICRADKAGILTDSPELNKSIKDALSEIEGSTRCYYLVYSIYTEHNGSVWNIDFGKH